MTDAAAYEKNVQKNEKKQQNKKSKWQSRVHTIDMHTQSLN